MTPSFRERNPEAVTGRRIRSLPSSLLYRCGYRSLPDPSRYAEIDSSHALIIEKQPNLPREHARLVRHLRGYRDRARLARRDRNGQTAHYGTRSVPGPADYLYRMIYPIDDLDRLLAQFTRDACSDID
jgi:hypothetical protein